MSVEKCPLLKKHEASLNLIYRYKDELKELTSYLKKPYIPIWGEEKIRKKELIELIKNILFEVDKIEKKMISKSFHIHNCLASLKYTNYKGKILDLTKSYINFKNLYTIEAEHCDKLDKNLEKIVFLHDQVFKSYEKMRITSSILADYRNFNK